MKNTGIEYDSTDRTPVVLPEMADLLPPLAEEQLAVLEADLLKNGCYSPIIVNEKLVIIDGHHRQSLCEKHGLPYKMAVFSFGDLLEAKRWALDNQKGRRNLDKWELGKIALKLKPDIEARAKANQSAAGGDKSDKGALLATLPEALPPVDTRKELADAVGLGERTMGKVMQIDEHAPDAVKDALDSGDLSINQGYNITRQVQDLPEEQREEVAAQAVELAKAKKEVQALDAEADRRGKIAGLFCKAFERAVLLTPTEENVRFWVEGTRMRPDEIEDSMSDLKNALQKRLEENYAAYTAQLTKKSFADLIDAAEEIAAAKYVCEHLATACTDKDAALLLRFENPLEVMRDRWLEETDVDRSEEIGHMIWTVQDKIEDFLLNYTPARPQSAAKKQRRNQHER